jgi:hypothetical protein
MRFMAFLFTFFLQLIIRRFSAAAFARAQNNAGSLFSRIAHAGVMKIKRSPAFYANGINVTALFAC